MLKYRCHKKSEYANYQVKQNDPDNVTDLIAKYEKESEKNEGYYKIDDIEKG